VYEGSGAATKADFAALFGVGKRCPGDLTQLNVGIGRLRSSSDC